ncbi:MAG: hypothetical protein NT145_07430 [Elusimicrobia bacterium]|nr:hypothetical protein [Elusimicrobiota bacterium]
MTFGRMLGMYMLVPATVLLTISYFVMAVNGKLDKKGLKTFGTIIVILLFLSALLAIVFGTMILALGKPPIVHSIKAVIESVASK